jgi:regulator of protease activity HflC (stomatin/prohibitin superfamily)
LLDGYEIGVIVSQITIENAAPPAEVADAYDEVQRAEQNEDQLPGRSPLLRQYSAGRCPRAGGADA